MKNVLYLFCFLSLGLRAQESEPDDNNALLNLTLKCVEGGVFSNQPITIKNTTTGTVINAVSGLDGKAKILLPVNSNYEMQVGNFSEIKHLNVPNAPNMTMNNTMSYSRNDQKIQKELQMTPAEIAQVDKGIALLPDTTYSRSTLKPSENLASLTIWLMGVDKKPLVDERVTISGRKNKKNFVARSGVDGTMIFLLPKGDTYDISFPLDTNYDVQELKYVRGIITSNLHIEYLGTKEIIRRAKEKEKRMKEEEARRAKEKKEFEEYRKKAGLSAWKAREKEIEEYVSGKRSFKDDVILKVFERNKHWKDKLVVCDLTGSMSPYAAQLELWYKLNHLKEQNLQFVFFNDGDNLDDSKKKIGQTGGIYYYPSKGIDSVAHKMAAVQAAGDGGDTPENNMEALIKGTKNAKPFKELVMIVDNRAPVKDIELLESFNIPVRIILCGVSNEIEPDYLKIAWRTKGSVHTMEEDILGISKLMDGQEIKIGNMLYKLMKGKFVPIYKS